MVNKIGIVCLSRGILGEPFLSHELELGIKRLKEMGIEVVFASNSLKGIDYIRNHPKARANDLVELLNDDSIDMIMTAIGGDDTYRLLPFLFDNDELKTAIRNKNKIFLGFSDTTINHFMFNKLGYKTFYGQAFLPDICELSPNILPYTKDYFVELVKSGFISAIKPSEVWYKQRESFDKSELGIPLKEFKNEGFKLLQGASKFKGKIFGGCLDTIYDMFYGDRYIDMPLLCEKYKLFPSLDYWKDKILLLETSEELMPVTKFKKALNKLKEYGVFSVISGIIFGKPMNDVYKDEYEKAILEVIDNKTLPIVTNINIGHACPRCIIPFNVDASVNIDTQTITFDY